MYKMKISDLFALRTAKMIIEIPLYKYQMCFGKNQNKTLPDCHQKSDESNEMDLDIDNEDIQ